MPAKAAEGTQRTGLYKSTTQWWKHTVQINKKLGYRRATVHSDTQHWILRMNFLQLDRCTDLEISAVEKYRDLETRVTQSHWK